MTFRDWIRWKALHNCLCCNVNNVCLFWLIIIYFLAGKFFPPQFISRKENYWQVEESPLPSTVLVSWCWLPQGPSTLVFHRKSSSWHRPWCPLYKVQNLWSLCVRLYPALDFPAKSDNMRKEWPRRRKQPAQQDHTQGLKPNRMHILHKCVLKIHHRLMKHNSKANICLSVKAFVDVFICKLCNYWEFVQLLHAMVVLPWDPCRPRLVSASTPGLTQSLLHRSVPCLLWTHGPGISGKTAAERRVGG